MKKRWIAMALAMALLLSLLSGCGRGQESQSAQGTRSGTAAGTGKTEKRADFYTLWEEICDIQEAEVHLRRAWHGATLVVAGTVSRTNHTAELSLSFADTDGQDREWTQIRVIDSDVYLNVGELAESTCAFPLTALRKSDIVELQSLQTAPWMLYQWEGELWEGIPAWKDLLDSFWQDSRAELEPHMKRDGKTGFVLTLKGKELERDGGKTAQRLLDNREAYLQGFLEVMDQQSGLRFALPESNTQMFDKLWNKILRQKAEEQTDDLVNLDGDDGAELPTDDIVDYDAADEAEQQDAIDDDFEDFTEAAAEPTEQLTEAEPLTAVEFAIGHADGQYTVALRHNDKAVLELTLSPVSDFETEAPEDVMLFDSYYADIYYLVTMCRDYVEDVLEGTQPEDTYNPEIFDQELEQEPERWPMDSRTAEGYEGVELISFLTDGGTAQSVPILTGWQSNSVSSQNDDGALITYLTLRHENWEELIHPLEAQGSPEEDAAAEVKEYYDLLVGASGYQVVEEISPVSVSGDGRNAACGFSYQENPYAPAEARLVVLMRQIDANACTALEFELNLDAMTDAQRQQLNELFRYLGLEVPISLKIAQIAE